jgi:redox-sensitive bicupin YhaK (pirin superfamily)
MMLRASPARRARVGDAEVRRLLPQVGHALVGPWCFVDHYGPAAPLLDGTILAPHPHIGLQTVSWLLEGELSHGDSIGSRAAVRPGELALMTAGSGITHWEVPRAERSPILHGVQLWVALPSAHRDVAPAFAHHVELPSVEIGALHGTLLMGEFAGQRSPAKAYSPIVGVDLAGPGEGVLSLRQDFEYALVVMQGQLTAGSQVLAPGVLYDLAAGATHLGLTAGPDARALLLGGAPFAESIVMWWNFVAGEHEAIAQARATWQAGGFGDRAQFPGPEVAAPPLPPGRLKPRR